MFRHISDVLQFTTSDSRARRNEGVVVMPKSSAPSEGVGCSHCLDNVRKSSDWLPVFGSLWTRSSNRGYLKACHDRFDRYQSVFFSKSIIAFVN